MCGIGGIYLPLDYEGQAPISDLTHLWQLMSDRGNHACGFALKWSNSENPIVVKQPSSSWEIADQIEQYASSDFVQYMMLHTRYATQGSVKNNENNHPVVGYDMIVTHNGVLRNDRHVLKTLKRKPMYDVDTEAINASLRLRSPKYTMDNVQGSMSLVWVDRQESEIVHLLTNGQNPMVIGRLHSGAVVWASMEYMLEESFGLEIKTMFHALPFKEYKLHPDGRITSRFVSKQRADPDAGFRYVWSKATESVSTVPVVAKTPQSKKRPQTRSKKVKNGKKKVAQSSNPKQELEYAGWRLNSDTGMWYATEAANKRRW